MYGAEIATKKQILNTSKSFGKAKTIRGYQGEITFSQLF